MKKTETLIALLLLAPSLFALETPTKQHPSTPKELLSKPYLYELTQHLYRWYMDEADILNAMDNSNVTFWVRNITPKLDDGDNSRLAEIILPDLHIAAKVKQADYTIDELGVHVSNETFKICNVARVQTLNEMPANCSEVLASYQNMRGYLFRIRNNTVFPDEQLLLRLREAVRNKLANDQSAQQVAMPSDEKQRVYLSPLSPMANEIWVFWENGHMLLHFASDLDLVNPAVWEHDKLSVKTYDLNEQVVVSHDEASGSNAYLTRDQAGRALYNCIILGKRLELDPEEIQ